MEKRGVQESMMRNGRVQSRAGKTKRCADDKKTEIYCYITTGISS